MTPEWTHWFTSGQMLFMTVDDAIATLADRIGAAERVLFITGAGLSADSGLPTYRGVGGLYEDGSDAEAGIPIEVALSGPMLSARPELTWRHIARIEAACRGASPNRGHEVIAALEAKRQVVVLTQNVDGFHRAAGSTDVIDIHGDVHHLHCTGCRWREHVSDYAHIDELPPRCWECGSVLRPEVVLFEEMLPEDKLGRLLLEVSQGFDVAVSVGTSALFSYIAQPMLELRAKGAFTAEINPDRSEVTDVVELAIPERAASILDRVMKRMEAAGTV